MGGQLTANSEPESFDPSVDPLSLMNNDTPMLSHLAPPADDTPLQTQTPPAAEPVVPDAPEPAASDSNVVLPEVKPPAELQLDDPVVDLPTLPAADALPGFEPLPTEPVAPTPPTLPPLDYNAPTTPAFSSTTGEKSLAELEEAVDSPHLHANEAAQTSAPATEESLDAARDAVMAAMSGGPQNGLPQPTQSVGAEGYLNVQDIPDTTVDPVASAASAAPQDLTIPVADPTPPTSVAEPASTAPPVPPPLPLDDLAKLAEPPQQ
jgi:hypothetical protein